jgi:hypothetical protein
MQRKWTEEEIEFLKQNHSTVNNKELGKILKRNYRSIACKTKKNGKQYLPF